MIQEFTKLNAICNEFEDRHVKSKIMEQLYKLSNFFLNIFIEKFYVKIILEFYKYEEENIKIETYPDDNRACCAAPIDCLII